MTVRITYYKHIRVAEWGLPEYREIIRCVSSGTTEDGTEITSLSARLSTLYGESRLLMLNRARYGLQFALKALAQRDPRRNEVIVPGYICRSVIDAITHCDLRPVPAGVNADLNISLAAAERLTSGRTLALICAHMYGAPAQIEELEALCHNRGVALIDDAAQVTGISIGRRPLGTFGACGLLSFSQSKSIVAGEGSPGGVLIVNDESLEGPIAHVRGQLQSARYQLGDMFRFMCERLWGHHAALLTYYLDRIRQYLASPTQSRAPTHAAAMPNVSAAVALRQLDSLSARIVGRTSVAKYFHDALATRTPAIALPQYIAGRYLTRVMALLPENIDITRLRHKLGRNGIGTRRGYEIDPRFLFELPELGVLSGRLLELPSHSRMTRDEVEDIVRTLAYTMTER